MITSDDVSFNVFVQHDNHEEYDEKTGKKKLVTHGKTIRTTHKVLPWHSWYDHLDQECCDEFKRFFEYGCNVKHEKGEKYIKFTDANEQILNYCPFCGKRLEVIQE